MPLCPSGRIDFSSLIVHLVATFVVFFSWSGANYGSSNYAIRSLSLWMIWALVSYSVRGTIAPVYGNYGAVKGHSCKSG